MDIHHHPQTHPKKKWKDYLFEFLMLFLAVSASFFVENQREHFIEKKREMQFIQSMVKDLNSDIYQLDSINNLRSAKQVWIDSMLLFLSTHSPNEYGSSLNYFARRMPRNIKFLSNEGTLQQLKNAGNLRLLRSREAVDLFMKYDQSIRNWKFIEDREESLIQQYYPALKTMFDATVFESMVNGMQFGRPSGNPHLLIRDKQRINELYSHIHFSKKCKCVPVSIGGSSIEIDKIYPDLSSKTI